MSSLKLMDQKLWLQLKDKWNSLLDNLATASIFSTWEWLHCWWQNFAKGKKLFILYLKEGNDFKAIAPFFIEKKWGIRFLRFLGEGASDMLTILAPSEIRDEFLQQVFNYLEKKSQLWDLIDLKELSSEDACFKAFLNKFEQFNYSYKLVLINYHPQAEGDYLRKQVLFSKRYRKTIRNRLNRIRRFQNLKLQFLHCNCINGKSEEVFSKLLKIDKASAKFQKRQSLFSHPANVRFHSDLFKLLAPQGLLDLSFLQIGSKDIAYCYNYRYQDKIYCYDTSYVQSYYKLSPGKILIYYLIKHYRQDLKFKKIFLGRGLSEEKLPFSQKIAKNYRILAAKKLHARFVILLIILGEKAKFSLRKIKWLHYLLYRLKEAIRGVIS